MSNRTFLKILEEIGWPNVYLVDHKQFEKVAGVPIKGTFGMSSEHHPIITLAKGLRGKQLANTIYHEIAHQLFPHRPHWWIECVAERMARGGGRGYWSIKYERTVDEVPARSECLKLFRRAAQRFNAKNISNTSGNLSGRVPQMLRDEGIGL